MIFLFLQTKCLYTAPLRNLGVKKSKKYAGKNYYS